MARYSIGRASARSGVKVTTIRYYERSGLMPTPSRSGSGRRLYDDDDVARLRFIRHARALGFPVESIAGLLALQSMPAHECEAADALARRHLEETRARIQQLQALEAELLRMLRSCEGGRIEGCAILATLGDHDRCATEH